MGAQPTRAHVIDREIAGYAIDSRLVAPGDLFFALSPEDYERHCFTATSFGDAHQFIPQAFERGAVAAVGRAARVRGDESLLAFGDRLLLVDDVIEGLQKLAAHVLATWGQPVVAITGSAGKTTTKDLTAHVLSLAGKQVLKTRKNFNNELGLPLSILQMESAGHQPDQYQVAVLEMGMSVPGEIARLCRIAPPDIGVVLLVAPAHLEFFGSIDAIAAGKAQLVEGIKPGGTAILNADDERVAAMRARHDGPVLFFGIEKRADVSASQIESAGLGLLRFRLRTPRGEAAAELPLPGRHNLMNALAAAAVATCFEIEPEEIAGALAQATVSKMRGEVIKFTAGFTLIDDSYNSNPRSLESMVRALAEGGAGARRRIVVAGEMLELGPTGAALHREVGRAIARAGIDLLWGVRGLAREIIEGARAAGMSAAATRFFESADEAAAALVDEAREGDVILVKGSRGVQTDRIVEALRERYDF